MGWLLTVVVSFQLRRGNSCSRDQACSVCYAIIHFEVSHFFETSARDGVICRTKALLAKQKRPIYPGPSVITSPFDPGGWSGAISARFSNENSSDCGVQLRELLSLFSPKACPFLVLRPQKPPQGGFSRWGGVEGLRDCWCRAGWGGGCVLTVFGFCALPLAWFYDVAAYPDAVYLGRTNRRVKSSA
jgi:hypothetical protein